MSRVREGGKSDLVGRRGRGILFGTKCNESDGSLRLLSRLERRVVDSKGHVASAKISKS